ncbi:hypothetical protein BST61_g10185 [Cercospora zeina]
MLTQAELLAGPGLVPQITEGECMISHEDLNHPVTTDSYVSDDYEDFDGPPFFGLTTRVLNGGVNGRVYLLEPQTRDRGDQEAVQSIIDFRGFMDHSETGSEDSTRRTARLANALESSAADEEEFCSMVYRIGRAVISLNGQAWTFDELYDAILDDALEELSSESTAFSVMRQAR